MTPNEQLCRALDRAYGQFAGYPRPLTLDISPYKDSTNILRVLSPVPLRELTGQQIGPYAGSALLTAGSIPDYKHFLPRILEEAVRDPVWVGVEPPIIATRLKRASWRAWPAGEISAIIELYVAALRQVREMSPSYEQVETWVCGLAALDEDVVPELDAWIPPPSIDALLQLAQFTRSTPSIASQDADKQIYWAYVDGHLRSRIVDWLRAARIESILRGSFDALAPSDRWIVEQALEALRV
jgi:hypothetical protein